MILPDEFEKADIWVGESDTETEDEEEMTVYTGDGYGYPRDPSSSSSSSKAGHGYGSQSPRNRTQQDEKRQRRKPRSLGERTVVRLGNGLHISFHHHHHRRGDAVTAVSSAEEEEGVYHLARQLRVHMVGHETSENSQTETRRGLPLRRSKHPEASTSYKQSTHQSSLQLAPPPYTVPIPDSISSQQRRRPSLTPVFSHRIPLRPPGLSGVGLWSYNRENDDGARKVLDDPKEEKPTNPSPIVTPNGGVKDLLLAPETTSQSRSRTPIREDGDPSSCEESRVAESTNRGECRVGFVGSLLAWTASWGWRRR